MNYADLGFLKLAAIAPPVHIGNPQANAGEILQQLQQPQVRSSALVAFPELCVSGYTCEDLFFNHDMVTDCEAAVAEIAAASTEQIVIVGAPFRLPDGRLLNAAFVCQRGEVLGVVPKLSLIHI